MSSAVAPILTGPEPYPIRAVGPKPFFPAVCLSTHWDPTRIYARTVPTQLVSLPLDFRPYAKVCLEYRTSAPEQAAPEVPDDLVFPNGGDTYSPTRYINSIDDESLLRRLDRPLGTCDPAQYQPPEKGDMYVDRLLVPRTPRNTGVMIQELSMPKSLLRTDTYHCRKEADQKNWDRSPRLFNNTTKQDRYTAPPTVEAPRPNIWSNPQRCQPTPLAANQQQSGNRAWGSGDMPQLR